MRESQILEKLEMFSSSQWGLITAAQAQNLGVERLWLSRMNARGMLQRVRHGVYALPSAQYGTLQDLQAAWLYTEASAPAEDRFMSSNRNLVVVSHVSAAVVHQLGEVVSTRHEFSSEARRQTSQKDVRFYRSEVPVEDVEWVGGLPVTSVVRTVSDLAESATDFDHLSVVVRDAVERHNVKVSDLAERLFPFIEKYGASSGVDLVQSLLDKAGYSPEKDPSVTKLLGVFPQFALTDPLSTEIRDLIRSEMNRAIDQRLGGRSL